MSVIEFSRFHRKLIADASRKDQGRSGGIIEGASGSVLEMDYERPVFVDWLTASQVHIEGGLPIVNDGWKVDVDNDRCPQFETAKRLKVQGSYDSTMHLRCDGTKIEFHGNIARYGRRDNVFGYCWDETVRRVNDLLNLHGLPPFTLGDLARYADRGECWSGARASRIDITTNHATFNWPDAQQLIQILGRHHVGRQRGTLDPDGHSVVYGSGSKYVYSKCYLKAAELIAHRRKSSGEHVAEEVVQWCKDMGVVREEHELKSRYLTQNNLAFFGQITQERLEKIHRDRSQLRRLNDMTYPDLSQLSPEVSATLLRYQNGLPITLKKSQFYKHRRVLLAYGVDISVPSNVTKFTPPVRVIERAVLVAPEWYRRKYG